MVIKAVRLCAFTASGQLSDLVGAGAMLQQGLKDAIAAGRVRTQGI